jgi:MFS transporter, ACS family, solute carrier family 17 (sodium-dependent inorganic phosphate cotransporter), other
MATAMQGSYVLCTVGVGEGFVLPSMNSIVATQISALARARALGVIFALFHAGNLVGLALSPLIIQNYGWHSLFLTYGVAGFPLLALWYLTMPSGAPVNSENSSTRENDPQPAFSPPAPYSPRIPPARATATPDKPQKGSSPEASLSRITGKPSGSNNEKRESILLQAPSVEPDSVSDFLQHPPVIAIAVANVANHWGYFIFQAWMPAYFAYEHGFDVAQASMMAFAPWIAMAVGSAVAGVVADHLITRMPVCPSSCGQALLTILDRIKHQSWYVSHVVVSVK